MKSTSIFLLVFCCTFLVGLGVHAQGPAQSAQAGAAPSKSEMPPALKGMQGTPGYEKEHQKWLNSQKQDPAHAQSEASKNVAALKSAHWTAAPASQKGNSSSEGSPYHQYKGISDPAEAKKAWIQDQRVNGK